MLEGGTHGTLLFPVAILRPSLAVEHHFSRPHKSAGLDGALMGVSCSGIFSMCTGTYISLTGDRCNDSSRA